MSFRNIHTRGLGFSAALVALACGVEAPNQQGIATAQQRIIGGSPAEHGAYPWQVWIEYMDQPQCGGVLLDPRWVLTAAHCLSGANYDFLYVAAGEHDRSTNEGTEQYRTVENAFVHERYSSSTGANDIALIYLSSPLTLDDYVQPISLSRVVEQTGTTGVVTGWGRTHAGPPYDDPSVVLMQASLPIVDPAECASLMDPIHDVTDSMLCAGFPDGERTFCFRDSGGPLAVEQADGSWRLAGVVNWSNQGCTQYSVFARARSYLPWIRKTMGLTERTCSGRTVPGATAWKQYGSSGVYLDVDTSPCSFGETPLYFASVGGNKNHWTTTGATSIYAPTATGFRVYLYYTGITPALANSWDWHIDWEGSPNGQRDSDLCTGKSSPTNTDWRQYDANAVYVDVDTSACNYTTTRRYITSLGGNTKHWSSRGVSSVYAPTATGFRVIVKYSGITVADAKTWQWHVNWQAVPRSQSAEPVCHGGTSSSSTDWKYYAANAIYTDVDTSDCGYTSTPLVFTSIGGDAGHYDIRGATSIYRASPTGFRVYLHQSGITASEAEQLGWHVNYRLKP